MPRQIDYDHDYDNDNDNEKLDSFASISRLRAISVTARTVHSRAHRPRSTAMTAASTRERTLSLRRMDLT